MSGFDSKIPPGVTSWNKKVTTCQILYEKVKPCQILVYKFYNVSNSASKFFPLVTFWFRIFTTCVAWKQKVYNASYFESKDPYLVRFWIKIFTKCLILIDGNQKESDFELKTPKSVGIWKNFFQKFTWIFLFSKMDKFCPLRDFQRHDFEKKNSLHRVEIFVGKIATWQILD